MSTLCCRVRLSKKIARAPVMNMKRIEALSTSDTYVRTTQVGKIVFSTKSPIERQETPLRY